MISSRRVMPLVDLTFLLAVSSILVNRIYDTPVESPSQLANSQTTASVRDDHLSVMVSRGTQGLTIAVGQTEFPLDGAGIDAAAAEIANQLATSSSQSVDLRASGALSYEEVEPALHAISQASQSLGNPVRLRVFTLDGARSPQ